MADISVEMEGNIGKLNKWVRSQLPASPGSSEHGMSEGNLEEHGRSHFLFMERSIDGQV
ncbi:MAG: hypothetical protein H6622_18250 [Halobacteriovoraceae bacterium]|nr:hypothetical protein [Halobacteriovoraceae bacterium]